MTNITLAYLLLEDIDDKIKSDLDVMFFNRIYPTKIIQISDNGVSKYGYMIFLDNYTLCYDNNANDILKYYGNKIAEDYKINVYVKYFKSDELKMIECGNTDLPCEFDYFIRENNNFGKVFFFDGMPFKINQLKRYVPLTDKNTLKKGMIVEILNKNKWVSKVVENVEEEYENIYKLFMKYNKIRYVLE